MRHLLASLALALVLVTGMPGAMAQTADSSTTTIPEGGHIIPEPNSGVEPQDAGDRGGALQTVLFVGIVGAVVVMGAIVVRQSRKARAERGF